MIYKMYLKRKRKMKKMIYKNSKQITQGNLQRRILRQLKQNKPKLDKSH